MISSEGDRGSCDENIWDGLIKGFVRGGVGIASAVVSGSGVDDADADDDAEAAGIGAEASPAAPV